MGRYAISITVTGSRSAHNSLQDKLDLTKLEWLESKIKDLIDNSDFDSLDLTITSDFS